MKHVALSGQSGHDRDSAPGYRAPLLLFNSHLETIYPAVFRRVHIAPYVRERIPTPDGDFLDLDWLKQHSRRLVIIQHGLEGNSFRAYVKGMAKRFFAGGFDVLAWNFRGCSEELNLKPRFYHSGATEDLVTVISHAAKTYNEINLVGFSLGGNMTLKYLGEGLVDTKVTKAVVFSVPVELETSCRKISGPANRLYAWRFLRSLKSKIRRKARIMNDIDASSLDRIATLMEFDDVYTAPLHGFAGALDYYHKCGAIAYLNNIRTPTLIVNTKNDPFLSRECFPWDLVKGNPFLRLETPERGGHVGFAQFNKNGVYWSEERAYGWIIN